MAAGEAPEWWGREHTGLDELHHLGRHRILRSTSIVEHRLPCWEIGLVVKGELSLRLPGGERRAVGGQALVVPPETSMASGAAPVRGMVHWIGVLPQPRRRMHSLAALDGDEGIRLEAALRRWQEGILPAGDGLAAAAALACARIAAGAPALARRSAGLEVLLRLQDALEQPAGTGDGAREAVAPALAIIAAEACRDHDLDGLARACGLGRTAFNVLFRRATGFSPRDYVNQQRLSEAKRLLGEGLAVAMVARRLGYSSGQYLATAFRRCFGRSPSAWRRPT